MNTAGGQFGVGPKSERKPFDNIYLNIPEFGDFEDWVNED